MEKLQKQTVESFIESDGKVGRYFCKICEKGYKHEKTCFNHVFETHSEDKVFKATLENIETEEKELKLKSYRDYLERIFTENENDWQETTAVFFNKLQEYTIENALSWYAEETVKKEEKYRRVKEAEEYYNEKVRNDFNKVNLCEFKDGMVAEIEDIKKELIRCPYRHSSTSLMSNAVEEWKMYARAKMVDNMSYSSLTEILYLTNQLINLM